MRITMSGKCFEATLADSSFLSENDFPQHTRRSVGKGTQYAWEISDEQRAALVDHVTVLYECSSGWDMEEQSTIDDRAAMREFLRRNGVEVWS